eukprot:CAMPEP_0172301554 /NCGR_PEP_ID=MMETSP1058-20130122/3409_1 /TAXON_ID=83371 /ORGANISM="Detonula confervacea, Strain CCMP 353" /LENGTH=1058 /DNA_ID=CAMNT_0013011699 /DNA_START=100 /DNA_END=3275 /DNA_ORIENTATION=+
MSGGRGRGRGRGRGERGNTKREKGGRGQQGKKHNNNRSSNRQPISTPNKSQSDSSKRRKAVLLLHGNRQTGEVLLGRMDKLKRALLRDLELDVIAPDAPHLFSEEDALDYDDVDGGGLDGSTRWQRTWWHRKENTYHGLEESISMLDQIWNNNQDYVAIVGFSQGSRLAHIISILHTITNGVAFPGLKCVIHFSGYGDCPMPDNFGTLLKDHWGGIIPSLLTKLNKFRENYHDFDDVQVNLPSLHVMGESDALVPLKSSEALLKWYVKPSVHVHPGSHFVPVKKLDIEKYLLFFNEVVEIRNLPPTQPIVIAVDGDDDDDKGAAKAVTEAEKLSNTNTTDAQPDEEHAQTQIDEVTALAQIFPTEFRLLSKSTPRDTDNYDPDDYFEENRLYKHPIKYSILLLSTDSEQSEEQLWPPKEISLCIQYPADYPDIAPTISLIHDMNYLEFSMHASDALLDAMRKAMEDEAGMPCGMGMVYAARVFFEDGGLASCTKTPSAVERNEPTLEKEETQSSSTSSFLRPSNAARIKDCNAQGLEVASTMLKACKSRAHSDDAEEVSATDGTMAVGKGGKWHYTVGLVGKPSAGKSTFFNAATAFARQRGEGGGEVRCEDGDDSGIILGGASMAPHPFTTIDPNIGYCLIPAPSGACPEDEVDDLATLIHSGLVLGSSHGRDSKGRRFIPVCLKDVAGLVPGAYQGRGRGNKFLDDLTDADVLVHIVDASGSSDAEGNKMCNGGNFDDLNHPLNDLEWVRNELVEWVYYNVSSKWDGISRRGKQKLIGMFSGYKQRQSFTEEVCVAVENFVFENEGRKDIFSSLETWDEGDLHRLVSAFLGARFPMALALNKGDIPTATQYIKDIKSKLPIHGAHTGVGLSAYEEMKFIRHHVALSFKDSSSTQTKSSSETMGGKVWECLQSAVSLREPTLVFPVNDMNTYEPLPGMSNCATRDSSLPNLGFISCITAARGHAPSQWDSQRMMYTPNTKESVKTALRDVILMKPGSTVEDVFQGLKGLGALQGEFVRAEAASRIGEKPKPVSKYEVVGEAQQDITNNDDKKKRMAE